MNMRILIYMIFIVEGDNAVKGNIFIFKDVSKQRVVKFFKGAILNEYEYVLKVFV